MKLFTLVLLIGLFTSFSVDISDEPTGHPLKSEIAPVADFGLRYHPVLKIRRMHAGVDFQVEEGTPVYATGDGTVKLAEENTGYGKYIIIQHANGFETVYAHLSELDVSSGVDVKKGEQIGLTGNTGFSQGPHLHYEIRKDRRAHNPADYLPKP